VEEQERRRRGSAFGAVAQAYARHRPDYPQAAVRWSLEPAATGGGGTAVRELRVLDLGAGTGKLTAVLTELGAKVTAVEPDLAMLAQLRRLYPDVPAMEGSAEAIPLPDGSVDAVLCGQAMHWFDMDRAVPEIARVLVPGGTLAALWNADDDRVEWVKGLHERSRGAGAPSLSLRRAEAAHFDVHAFGTQHFGPVERTEFPHGQSHTVASMVALIGTHSQFLIMPAAAREALLAEVTDYLTSRPETASGEFVAPIVTAAVRVLRH
jgi:SAM-dependent methyltransferase